ncbi:MAG TPA: hypothetical protein VH143_17600 [Kofleriaceae bacterium]|jgi:hypothetical protein|nr:hypothetical protein [Kofleriaceae bacterium]
MGDERAPPPWVRDGVRAAWHEARGYLATTWQMMRAPARFMDSWRAGRADAMNPLAMLATGAALVAAAHQVAGAIVGIDHPDGIGDAVLSALGPYAHYVAIGLLCHLVLAPRGTRDVHVLDTIAAALFAGAGPAALAEALGWLVMCAIWPFVQSLWVVAVVFAIAFSVFCFSLAGALGGLHRPTWWRIMLAFAVAFPATGLVFGVLEPPGNYGLHWIVKLDGGPPISLGM